MSGSAIADAAGIGKVIIDMMRRNGRYPAGYAAAITAAAGVIGPIIPPSIPMVLYALVSDASIGYLFLGGVMPGLLLGLVLMLYNPSRRTRRNFPRDEIVPLRELPRRHLPCHPASDAAGDPARRHLWRRHDTDRGRRGRRRLRAGAGAVVVYRAMDLRDLQRPGARCRRGRPAWSA